MDFSVILLSELFEQMSSATVSGYEGPETTTSTTTATAGDAKPAVSKKPRGNSPRRYEDPAKKNRRIRNERRKPGYAAWINRRYGCDNLPEHHSRARCMIQGRISQLGLALERTADPVQRMKLRARIGVWNRKMSDEIRRNRFRKY